MTRWGRWVIGLTAAAGLVAAAAACSGTDEVLPTTTIVVSTSASAAVTEAQAFELQARAIARAWPEPEVCINEEIAPAGLRRALEARFDEVTYVAMVGVAPGIGWEACTLVAPGLVGSYRADVAGVDVWVRRGPLEGGAATYLFRWDGTAWVDATQEETGVTVTTAVS
jgi:hypothetical protein